MTLRLKVWNMKYLCVVFVLSMIFYGCQKKENQRSGYVIYNKEFVKKEIEFMKNADDMIAKRMYEVSLDCDRRGISGDEKKRRINDVAISSNLAKEKSKKEGYSLEFNPDWGGREKNLRTAKFSDLMPSGTEKEKKEKNLMKSMEFDLLNIDRKFERKEIDEKTKFDMRLEISRKYAKQMNGQ